MVRYKSVEGVFHTKTGSYKLNYENAKRLCALQGAQLATYSQLHKAWKAGAETCEQVNVYFFSSPFTSSL